MNKKLLKNIHPGEILLKDFLEPLGRSTHQLARESGIPYTTVIRLINEKTSITPEIAMKLSNFFGTIAKVWLGLQMTYDLEEVKEKQNRFLLL